ncbi:MAG: POTRA domain-containing protein, partial [Gammaproteobacteria bacterium]|nr:POTRA domain-containing protein [Gammaproteobacteria bacterium]
MTFILPGLLFAGEDKVPVKYDIWEYKVVGNTLIGADEIQRTLYPHLGPNKTVENIDLARKSLEDLYRLKGYPSVIVSIPPQTVDQAVVELKVTEGRVAHVKVTGARYFSLANVKDSLPVLSTGSIPYLPALKSQMASLNQSAPDRFVSPVMRPGKAPGSIDVELKVKDSLPFHGYAELNNKYSRGTSPLRAEVSLSYDNLWQKAHSLSFMFQTAPENVEEVKVFSTNYLMRRKSSRALTA